MNATARQTRSAENCAYVQRMLAAKQPRVAAAMAAMAEMANAACPRCSVLPPALRDHAFGRSGCKLVSGEPLLAARARGYAAESAADAVTAIRGGNLTDARALLHAALMYLDGRDAEMVSA